MSLLQCREAAGLDHLDVLYYAKHDLMTLRDMRPEERREALRRWDGNNPIRDVECTPSVTREVNAVTHVPVQYRARVEATKPETQTQTPKSNSDWDVDPWTGEKDSKTYKEWRAYYDNRRKNCSPHDLRKEWRILKLVFKIVVVAPLTILGALGLFSGQKE